MENRQNISSASLFHFIKRFEYLIDILRFGFQARYVAEVFPILERPFIIPMKCFCDLPLSTIKYHIGRYGKYGIGISKEFAITNSITPCIYVHENSYTIRQYLLELDKSNQNNKIVASSLLPYFKKYEEIIKEDNKDILIRYYDEREWRYIPRPVEFYDYFGSNLSDAKSTSESLNKSLTPCSTVIGTF
jgi:hypothetical protein